MAGRGKIFELLDFPKFSSPSVLDIDAGQTAISVIDRLFGGGFMSYGALWPKMETIVSGFASETFITAAFNFYEDDWKNDALQDVARLLKEQFGGKGSWYPIPTKPSYVLGFWFKPSIKGFWFFEGQAYAVLINPRKGQKLSKHDIRFLARGVHELHCVDDPNDPIPMIVDLSEHRKGEGRILRTYVVHPNEAITLEEFEKVVREFLKALALAGVAIPASVDDIVTLFKKK